MLCYVMLYYIIRCYITLYYILSIYIYIRCCPCRTGRDVARVEIGSGCSSGVRRVARSARAGGGTCPPSDRIIGKPTLCTTTTTTTQRGWCIEAFCLNSSTVAVSEIASRRWWCIESLFPDHMKSYDLAHRDITQPKRA